MQPATSYLKHLIALAMSAMTGICAKGQSSSQMSFFGTFGVMSGMMYKSIEQSENRMQFGYGGGINYTYFFKPTFGLTIGGEALTYANQFSLPDFPIGDDPADDGEEGFRLQYKITNYTEQQKIMSLLIPLMLSFETSGKKAKFFLSAGAKINIILSASYTGMVEGIKTVGSYPQYNIKFGEDKSIDWLGFGTYSNIAGSGKLPLAKISPVFAAEAGIKIALSRDWFLYLGGYFDYGMGLFNKPDKSQAFVKYNSNAIKGADFLSMNTVLYSQNGNESIDRVFVDNLSLMSTGVKVKVAFNSEIMKPAARSMDLDLLAAEPVPAPTTPAPAPLTNEAPPAEVKEQVKNGEEENVNLILKQRITFTLKSSSLTAKQKADLDRKVKILEKNTSLKLTIRGNANDFFDAKNNKNPNLKKAAEAKNKKLSTSRAKVIKDYMVSKGISASRIKVTARGSKSPLVPETTPRNRSKNRRSDFVVAGKK